MSTLNIIHRSKPGHLGRQASDQASGQAAEPVWATCLREIAFVDADDSQLSEPAVKDLEIYRDEKALSFLLEVLCGLRSPVLGETEVMGQFKNYLLTISPNHPLYRDPTLLPFLQTTVKQMRAKFLSATGSLSYGQIIRRWVKDFDHVTLWGFGSLGSEIWPWIKQKTRSVVVQKTRDYNNEVPFVIGEVPQSSVHLIAAPLSDADVLALAEQARLVIDLRDTGVSHPRVRTLQDLFAEIQHLQKQREDVLPRCRNFLAECIAEYADRHQIRPFGWEDLCG